MNSNMNSNIRFVVFDFDGVFSDGKFNFNNENIISKSYNAKDAYSLILLKNNDIKCGIITTDKIISIEHAPHIYNRLDKVSIGEDRPKLEILNDWLKEDNISLNDVAYIGDDLQDLEILKNVGFSACPNDAIKDIKNIVDFVSTKNGGEGAVREFVDLIIKNNKTQDNLTIIKQVVNNDGKITAVIPVRKGSTRCKLKNIRLFGDTSLLKLKIETLKKVKGIDKILVSSDCEEMIGIAKELGIDTYKRNEKYCTNDNPGQFFCNLADTINTNILMHVPVTTPLISVDQYNEIITKWNNIKSDYDSLNVTTKIKEFIWHNNKPVNYDRKNPPPSQDLPNFSYLNFGCNIISKESVLKLNNIVGENPFLFDLDHISGIDIDECSEFITSELLYNNSINDSEISKLILNRRVDNPELVDCTIRDGGYLNNWNYTDEEVLDCYKTVSDAGIDYFEIGFKSNKKLLSGKGKWCYSVEENINNIVSQYKGTKICVMAKIGTVTIDDFIEKKLSNIDMVRVLVARSTTKNNKKISEYSEDDILFAKNLCNDLINLGYRYV